MNKGHFIFIIFFVLKFAYAQELHVSVLYTVNETGVSKNYFTEKYYFSKDTLTFDLINYNDSLKPVIKEKVYCYADSNEYKSIADFVYLNALNKDYSFAPAAGRKNDFFETMNIIMAIDSKVTSITFMGFNYWLKQDNIYTKAALLIDNIRRIFSKCRDKE